MQPAFFSQLQIHNLSNLQHVREACRATPEQAIRLFAMTQADVSAYVGLSNEESLSFAFELDVSVLVPRFDSATLRTLATCFPNPDAAMLGTPLQVLNLLNLHALRETCRRSDGEAAWAYRIDLATAQAYANLDDAALMTIGVGLPYSAFVPRYRASNLQALQSKPHKARGLFAAVMESDLEQRVEALNA